MLGSAEDCKSLADALEDPVGQQVESYEQKRASGEEVHEQPGDVGLQLRVRAIASTPASEARQGVRSGIRCARL
jgi:hypothetical protein